MVSIVLLALVTTTTLMEKSAAVSVNEVMVKIGHTMESLFPVVFDDKKFADPASEKQLSESIGLLKALFNEAKPHFDIKSPTYRTSFNVIEAQLSDAQVAIKYNNGNHARNILKEFVSICSSCHTQDSRLRTLFSDVGRDHFTSDLQFAEFNYMTRNYNTALEYYNKYLNSESDISESEILIVMKRILTIYIQVYNRPDDAIKQFNALKNYQRHTKFSAKTLEEWLAGLGELQKKQVTKITNVNMDQLKVYVDEILGPLNEPGSAEFPTKKEKVARIWLRGVLYRYLNSQPAREDIPVILYWLAIIDRSVNYSFYYSLADMYLKECMLQYTSHPYAQKCYEEYESYITFAYSGSRGTDIPDDVKQELKALKVKVFSAPKH